MLVKANLIRYSSSNRIIRGIDKPFSCRFRSVLRYASNFPTTVWNTMIFRIACRVSSKLLKTGRLSDDEKLLFTEEPGMLRLVNVG
jgi:hypothetical protein